MPRRANPPVERDRISAFADWLAGQPLLTELTLTALTVLFGMQVLRVLIPGMFQVLGGQMGWSTPQLGLIGLIILVFAFASGPLERLTGNLRLVAIAAAGLALVRFVIQVWWGEPLFNLSLAIIGTLFFVIFLPAAFENARRRGGQVISCYALGLLGGIALDVAINGAAGTYDTVWQVQPLPLLLTLVLVIIQLLLLLGITPTRKRLPAPRGARASGVSAGRSFTWLAIGPFLFLELVIFQNIPRLATFTGWPLPIAFAFTFVCQLAGLAAAAWILSKPRQNSWPWALGVGVILTASLAVSYPKTATFAAPLFLVGQVLISSLIAMTLMSIATKPEKAQQTTIWIANGVGVAIFLALIIVYNGAPSLTLPFSDAILEAVAGAIVAACAIAGAFAARQQIRTYARLWPVPIFALIFLALPLAQTITWRPPTPITGQGLPVHVMSYDLNSGFNAKGKFDIEEMARVIENDNPDIVALQEVSRASLADGRVDTLTWLSQRLGMRSVFEPTESAFWGNAILSRYPILAFSRESLPPPDSTTPSGFLTALIDVGDGQLIKVITTQLTRTGEISDNVTHQSQTILDFWAGVGDTIIFADVKGQLTDSEITALKDAGLVDTTAKLRQGKDFTPGSNKPYVLLSPDLRIRNLKLLPSPASKYLPLVAEIR